VSELVIRGGVVVTVDGDSRVVHGDVLCRDGRIASIGGDVAPQERDYEVLDADGAIVMPGLVQSHVHMCQTLARGRADDLELLPWLRDVVWPYEGALDRDDLAASARLACLELLLGGTTAILDMGTVHHTDALFEAARDSGLRATIGKAMMDEPAVGVPPGLRESTAHSLDESARLCEQWHGAEGGRLRYAYAPRFALSCTDELLRAAAEEARSRGARLHTHTSENRDEVALVKKLRGADNIEYLHDCGLTGPDVGLAHCVWLSDRERSILRDTGTHVLHCPSSNLKLGSGVARIPDLRADGVSVSLGADGAPCNNNLDGFLEMRLAALIQKPVHGATAMRAVDVVRLATLGGARALGLEDEIGSLEVGKKADIAVVAWRDAHTVPTENPYSALVYACRASDVRHVVVDGRPVVRDRTPLTIDPGTAIADARQRATNVFDRLRAAES